MNVIPFLIKYSPALLIMSIITGIFSGVASSFMIALVNEKVSNIDDPGTLLAFVFVGLMVTALVSELISRLTLLRVSTRAVRKMRLGLCDQILTASLKNIEDHGSGNLMAALTEDIHAVTDALTQFPIQCIHAAITVACFGYLFYLSWPLAVVFLLVFGLSIVVHEAIARGTRPKLELGRQKWDDLISHYNGLIDGNKELKLHRKRREGFSAQELHPTAKDMMELSWGWNKIFAFAETFGQFVYYIVIGIILFIAPMVATFEPGVLTGFVLMCLFMSAPISAIVGSFPVFHRASVSVDKIKSLGLSLEKDDYRDISDEVSQASLGEFASLEMKEVVYHYEGEEDEKGFTLGPVNFAMKPGELVFVVGGNGSGKSSFARIISGLYGQNSGELLYNGQAIDSKNRDDYRQNFSVIFSDYYLFKVFYGLIDEDLAARFKGYLEDLQLTDKVKLVDGGLSTLDLSQGQRKRLALLTAFLEDRSIYLFDEWAADQDPEFKKVFYHRILPELQAKGKSVIVISHDDHYYEVADRIVRFADGVVIEDRVLSSEGPLVASTADNISTTINAKPSRELADAQCS